MRDGLMGMLRWVYYLVVVWSLAQHSLLCPNVPSRWRRLWAVHQFGLCAKSERGTALSIVQVSLVPSLIRMSSIFQAAKTKQHATHTHKNVRYTKQAPCDNSKLGVVHFLPPLALGRSQITTPRSSPLVLYNKTFATHRQSPTKRYMPRSIVFVLQKNTPRTQTLRGYAFAHFIAKSKHKLNGPPHSRNVYLSFVFRSSHTSIFCTLLHYSQSLRKHQVDQRKIAAHAASSCWMKSWYKLKAKTTPHSVPLLV